MTLAQASAIEVADLNNLWWHFLLLEFRSNVLFYTTCVMILVAASVALFLSISRRSRQNRRGLD